jgi:hypothetical protein
MTAYPKHLLIGAIVMSILSMTVQGLLIFQHSQGNDLVASPNTPHLPKPKTTEKSVESNVDVSSKAIQDQKNADVTKIIGILGETQNLMSGKKNLNPALIKSFEKLSFDVETIVKPYNLEDLKEPASIKNQTDILKLGAYVGQLLKNITSSGNGLSALNSLSPSANSFTANNSFFDLQRIPKNSPLRQISEVFQFYAKNVDGVQRNVFDLEAMHNLQQVLATGVEQISYLDANYDTFNSQVKETINNFRQTPWTIKSSQLNKDMQMYIESSKALNKVFDDKTDLKKASETLDPSFPKKPITAILAVVKPKEDAVSIQDQTAGVNIKKVVNLLDQVKSEISTVRPYANLPLQNLNKLNNELREVLNLSSNEAPSIDLTKPAGPLKNQTDVIEMAKKVQNVLVMITNQEKSLANLAAIGSTASIIVAPSALLDIQKISVESPIRPLALSFDEVQKANIAWQKNIFDRSAITNFLTAITHTNEQFSNSEAAINPQAPVIEEAIVKLRQIAWQSKSQDAKQTLSQFKDQLDFVKRQLLDSDKITLAANTEASNTSYRSFFSVRILQSLPLSLNIVVVLCLLSILWINMRLDKTNPDIEAKMEEALEKRTPYIALPIETKKNELIPELHQQIHELEQKFIRSYQSSEKVLSYLQEVMQQVLQLRTVHVNDESGPTYLHIDVSKPLEEIDAAMLSLKQIGIRLFLSILSNHSTRQLALETEQMNSLVEKTEATFADIKALVQQVNQKALPKRHSSDQAGMDLIELDLNQVLKEVKHWQDELTQMNQAIMSLNTLVGQYV